MTKRAIRVFSLNKKGASPVVSTLILTAGVIAMSIAVLYWTYSMGKIGNIEYSKNTAATSNAVSERLGFEHINGSANNLSVYINNWGKSDNITVANVLIMNSNFDYLGSNKTSIILKSISANPQTISGNVLHIGSDASFETNFSFTLTPNEIYYVRIVTTRGRTFDGSFIAT